MTFRYRVYFRRRYWPQLSGGWRYADFSSLANRDNYLRKNVRHYVQISLVDVLRGLGNELPDHRDDAFADVKPPQDSTILSGAELIRFSKAKKARGRIEDGRLVR